MEAARKEAREQRLLDDVELQGNEVLLDVARLLESIHQVQALEIRI